MDVNRTHATAPVGSGGSKQEHKRDSEDENKETGPETDGASGSSPRQDTEAFAIDGLLAGDLDPKVSQAFESLAAQIEPLRREVELSRGREAHLRELSEKHSFLPLSGRREFLRELTHILSHLEGLNPPVLIVMHLVNGDDIRQRLGRSALDGALIYVASVIESSLHPTDVAGNLGGNDFGLVLLAGGREHAENRVEQLSKSISARPYLWKSEGVTLRVVAGIAVLDGNASAKAAMNAADGDLLRSISSVAAAKSQAEPEDSKDKGE
ncbi:MAG: GGDEF domain-containing protein [Rhodospirillales bacterium]|nr:GGDEF domain-containing protein [Alphaproteobacteria bacterium]MBL6947940.1 GGDEF domain-containing protein [Rhodospirillales bacterium]